MLTQIDPSTEVMELIPIESIRPNPWQPSGRIAIDDDTAAMLGKSILEHGLIQNPIVRKKKRKPETLAESFSGTVGFYHYEMGDGWLRRAGFAWLVAQGHEEYADIPCVVRDLTDQQMADLVMESQVRKDLNLIELGELYQKYLQDFNITQTELGRRHNCSQGEIANTIRLLQLPEEIQQFVILRKITAQQARDLLRINYLPEDQKKIANDVVFHKVAGGQLSNVIAAAIWNNSMPLETRHEWQKNLVFDPLQECPSDCREKKKLGTPYSHEQKVLRCMNPDCWWQKNEVALEQKRKEAMGSAVKGTKDGIYNIKALQKLGWNNYSFFERGFDSASCAGCKKFAKGERYSGEFQNVCLDPSCMRKKKSQLTRERNKEIKKAEADLTARLEGLAGQMVHNVETYGIELALDLILDVFIRSDLRSKEIRNGVADMMGFREDPRKHIDVPTFIDAVSQHRTREDLLRMCIYAAITSIRYNQTTYDRNNRVLPSIDFWRVISRLEGRSAEFTKLVAKWIQEKCPGCECKTYSSGAKCYHDSSFDEKGKCLWYIARDSDG